MVDGRWSATHYVAPGTSSCHFSTLHFMPAPDTLALYAGTLWAPYGHLLDAVGVEKPYHRLNPHFEAVEPEVFVRRVDRIGIQAEPHEDGVET